MVKNYLKQAYELMKQNPLFSTLYVVGTGLAIAMTMIMAIVYYVKIAPVYPETNRKHTLYLDASQFKKEKRSYQSGVSYRALQEWFYPLKNASAVSAALMDNMSENSYIQPADRSGDFEVAAKLTDPEFFRIYSFYFQEGKAFTHSDLESRIHTAVITEDLARRLFGTAEGVVGRSFSLNYIDYRVCGVVRSASYLTPHSYAQVYVPYSVSPGYRDSMWNLAYLGRFEITFLVEDNAQADALHAEIDEIVRKENLIHPDDWTVGFWEQPTPHEAHADQLQIDQDAEKIGGSHVKYGRRFLRLARTRYLHSAERYVGLHLGHYLREVFDVVRLELLLLENAVYLACDARLYRHCRGLVGVELQVPRIGHDMCADV